MWTRHRLRRGHRTSCYAALVHCSHCSRTLRWKACVRRQRLGVSSASPAPQLMFCFAQPLLCTSSTTEGFVSSGRDDSPGRQACAQTAPEGAHPHRDPGGWRHAGLPLLVLPLSPSSSIEPWTSIVLLLPLSPSRFTSLRSNGREVLTPGRSMQSKYPAQSQVGHGRASGANGLLTLDPRPARSRSAASASRAGRRDAFAASALSALPAGTVAQLSR